MPDPGNGIDAFHLEIDITDEALVEWLEELPDDQVAARVEDTLRAGHFVLNLVQAAAGEEQMARYFRPVTDQMGRLEGTLEEIMRRAQKSQRLGEIGQNIVASQLTDAFPGDEFIDVSGKAEEADLRALFDVGAETPVEARIEVKLYSDDVPSKEIQKFRRDLEKTGIRYGLMVSLSSRLTGINTPLKIEETEGFTAVFVPDAGLDGLSLLRAAATLKAIILYHARAEAASRVSVSAIEQAWARLSSEVDELQAIARQVAGFRDAVRRAQEDLSAQLTALADRATESDIRLRHSVERLTGRLYEELAALPAEGGPPSLPTPTPKQEVLAALVRLEKDNDKRAAAFRRLYETVSKTDHEVLVDQEGTWRIIRDGEERASTRSTKTRVDVVFPVTGTVELETAIEKHKGDEVIVDGKDVEAMAKRVGERLGGKKRRRTKK